MPKIIFYLIVALLFSCTTEEEEAEEVELVSTCKATDTSPLVSAADITSPPTGMPSQIPDHYTVTKYLSESTYNMHIFGTSGVSDWMMIHTHAMVQNMVGSVIPESRRSVFDGHHVFVITDSDPIVPNGIAGQRNTGNALYTIVNEALVCATAVDTIRPDNDPEYRAWDTPVHEFGHAIELALNLLESSIELHQTHNPNYEASLRGEYFAWATERWFDARVTGNCGVDAVMTLEQSYFFSNFSGTEIWRPTCEGR